MKIECPICKSNQDKKENNDYFRIKQNIKSYHRDHCIIYQNFLNLISKKTGLSKIVIDILCLNERLSEVLKINKVWQIFHDFDVLIIEEKITFKESYKQKLSYIFANYIDSNKKYIINIEEGKNNVYLINNTILLNLFNLHQKIFYIEFNMSHCIPYDINLLTEDEKKSLESNCINYLYLFENINGKMYLKFNFLINENEDLSVIYEKIEEQIKYFERKKEDIKFKLTEENKKYFERALLLLEIQGF